MRIALLNYNYWFFFYITFFLSYNLSIQFFDGLPNMNNLLLIFLSWLSVMLVFQFSKSFFKNSFLDLWVRIF